MMIMFIKMYRHHTTKMRHGVMYVCSNTINCVNCKTLKNLCQHQVHTVEKGDMSQAKFLYFNRNALTQLD